MPGFNQRGPWGQGPMTGRKMGRCTDFGSNIKKDKDSSDQDQDQNQNQPENFQGRGFGFRGGRGRGMGFQNRYRGGF